MLFRTTLLTALVSGLALVAHPRIGNAGEEIGYIHAADAAAQTVTVGPASGSGGVVYQVREQTVLSGFEDEPVTVADLPSFAKGSKPSHTYVSFEATGAVLHWLRLAGPLDED